MAGGSTASNVIVRRKKSTISEVEKSDYANARIHSLFWSISPWHPEGGHLAVGYWNQQPINGYMPRSFLFSAGVYRLFQKDAAGLPCEIQT